MNRKTNTYILCMAVILGTLTMAHQASAQFYKNARAGIKGGFTASNLYVDDVDDEDARLGFHAGFFGQVLSSDAAALQLELLYAPKGASWKTDGLIDQRADLNLHYIDLPILAVIKIGDVLEIHGGGYVSYLVAADVDYSGDIVNGSDDLDRDNLKSFDYGVLVGLGVNFGNLQVGARYNLGLAEIADSDAAHDILGDSKNSSAQLFLAFNLNHSDM